MLPLDLPPDVEAVFDHFLTCEVTTLGRGGAPVTWPVLPVFWPECGQFVILSAAALAQKVRNVRRDPRVSLLYSEPAGSGLLNPPAVLVQGRAVATDGLVLSMHELEPSLLAAVRAQARKLLAKQPAVGMYAKNRLTRSLMDWYFFRLMITVTPETVQWWPEGDFARPPLSLAQEVLHVA